jgi:hypothetical protein
MKLRKTYDYRHSKGDFDISTAIATECESHSDGIVERAHDVANAAAKKVGDLLALLHEKGILTDDDVLSLLSSFEKAN